MRNILTLTMLCTALAAAPTLHAEDKTEKAEDKAKEKASDEKPAKGRTADSRRSDQPVDDTWITTKVKAKMVEDKQVSATNIHVKTVNGVVELTGTAKSMDESSQAASLARSVEGVKSVRNNIKVN